MNKVNLDKNSSQRNPQEFIITTDQQQSETLSFFQIPNVFYINGAQIPLNDIVYYQIVQREYVFRPAYKEKANVLKRVFSINKYEFSEMMPYAAIITESEFKSVNKRKLLVGDLTKSAIGIVNSVVSRINPGEIASNIAQGAVGGVLDKLGSAVGFEKYYCVFPSGRTTTISLGSIPPLVTTADGKVFEPTKRELKYAMPNENTRAIISTVPALLIKTQVDYLFYGNGINLVDVNNAYMQLSTVKPLV